MSGFCGLPVPSFFTASRARNVPDGYEPAGPSAPYPGEVHAQLLCPAPGGVCGPRFLGTASASGLLSLLCRLSSSILGLARHLAGLIGGLPRHLLGLVGGLARDVLGLARRL